MEALTQKIGHSPLVVLLCVHVGLNILGGHEPDLVTLLTQDAAQMVSSAARLHCHHAARQLGPETDNAVPRQTPA